MKTQYLSFVVFLLLFLGCTQEEKRPEYYLFSHSIGTSGCIVDEYSAFDFFEGLHIKDDSVQYLAMTFDTIIFLKKKLAPKKLLKFFSENQNKKQIFQIPLKQKKAEYRKIDFDKKDYYCLIVKDKERSVFKVSKKTGELLFDGMHWSAKSATSKFSVQFYQQMLFFQGYHYANHRKIEPKPYEMKQIQFLEPLP